MSNNFDEHNEDDLHQHSTNPRVVEIPVQHFSVSPSSSSGVNPEKINNGQIKSDKYKNPQAQDFFNRNNHNQGIFDDFQSPFDIIEPSLRNRSLFNREQPFGSRFDDFFRPNLSTSPHQSSADQYLNRAGKSPIREVLRQTSPAPNSYIDSNNLERTSRHSPTIVRTESPKLRTESPRLFNQSGIQIPVQHVPIGSDFRRTESPIRNSSTPPTSKLVEEITKQQSPQPAYQHQQKNKQPIVLPEPPQKVQKQVLNNSEKNPSDFIKNPSNQAHSRFEQSPKSSPEPNHPVAATKPQHKVKPQPVINLPKVIPLPQPQAIPQIIPLPQPEPHTNNSDNQSKKFESNKPSDNNSNNMGNTFQGQHSSNKRQPGNQSTSDFAHPHQFTPQPESHPHVQPQPIQKTQREKLDEIQAELEQYEIELTTMKPGCGKKDKLYLKLDEFLTRCLLKLDEIEKTDDIIHLRKSLIVTSNKLLDQLENIALETKPEENPETSTQDQNPPPVNESSSNTENNDQEMPDSNVVQDKESYQLSSNENN